MDAFRGRPTLAAVGIAAAMLLLSCWTERSGAQTQGIRWAHATLDQALAQARRDGHRVMVDFGAGWCVECRQLDAEVLETRAGGELTADLVAVHFDFDDAHNRPLVERFAIMKLPTVLVLTADGTQVGRISGYEGRDAWIAQLRAAKTGTDPLPGLRAAFASNPGDPSAAYALGEALLERGSPAEGEALLERSTWLVRPDAPAEQRDAAAHSLFLLGRYYQRVRRDPHTGRHVWRELAARFPESQWASGAWWWYATAEAEIGRPELGLWVLRERARTHASDADVVSQWAQFVVEHELRDDRTAAREALLAAIPHAPEADRAELEATARRLAN